METKNKNINYYYGKGFNLIIRLFLNHWWFRQIILFVIILITVTISWWMLAILGMSYEDGINTYGISKWSYMTLKYGIAFSYDFYQKQKFGSPIIMALLTTSTVIYILILISNILIRKLK